MFRLCSHVVMPMPFPNSCAPATWATPYPPGSPPDRCDSRNVPCQGWRGEARAGDVPLSASLPWLWKMAREVMLGAVLGIGGGWIAGHLAFFLFG
jgi:hypothetical protein